MKIRSIYKALVILPVFFSFLSCTKVSDQVVILYYSDPQAMFFVPVSTTLKLKGNIDSDKAQRACALSIDKYCSVAETLRRAGCVIAWKVEVN